MADGGQTTAILASLKSDKTVLFLLVVQSWQSARGRIVGTRTFLALVNAFCRDCCASLTYLSSIYLHGISKAVFVISVPRNGHPAQIRVQHRSCALISRAGLGAGSLPRRDGGVVRVGGQPF